ncbi:MAG: glycosyltransferase family 4 protein [Burkholderiales bacterium]|nr:glycosyltransferase family 4 protein [Burkholderiales bacterium]
MKLAIVRQTYNPHGGAERFVERALAALSKERSVQLSVIARRWQPQAGVEFVECDPPWRTSLTRDRGFASAVRSLLDAEPGRFDLVQSHERIPGVTLYRAGDGVHAAWLERRARAVGRVKRALMAADPYHRYVLGAERAMFTHPALEAVICNSRMVAGEIDAHFGVAARKIVVIGNAVDLERFHPRLRGGRDAVRAALQVPADAPVFLHAGSGFERKGVAQALRALARVPHAWLWVAGGDKREARYRRLAQELGVAARTLFLGPRDDLPQLLGAADAFVLATLYDPMPNAAIEALACGLPLITTTGCGAQELVEPGRNGFVVDALDTAALTEAMATLARPGAAASMGDAARAAVANLTAAQMVARLKTLYEHLLARQ